MQHDTPFEERRTVIPSPNAASAPSFASPAAASHLKFRKPRQRPIRFQPATSAPASGTPSVELLKLRAEIRRLEMLVKKLQSELEGEKQYCAELESQLRVNQES